MASESFLLADLRQTALAAGLFPLVLLAPGWVLGWALNLLDFRERSTAGRGALAVCFSVGAAPVVTDLVSRAFGLGALLPLYALLTVCFLLLQVAAIRRGRTAGPRPSRIVLCAVAVWVAVAALSLCDLQIGRTLYVSVTAIDYVKHVGVTDAIVRTGAPPTNPFYGPGHPIPLYYYYYWHLLCATVEVLSRGAVGARGAAFGGTIWGGLCFLSMLAVAVWFGRAQPPRRPMQRYGLALLLLGVTGLDLLAVAPANLLSVLWHAVPVYESGESWNEQVTAWSAMLLWVPQHIAATVAWVSAMTVCRRVLDRGGRREWAAAAYLALAAASAIGLSVWVSLAFGVCVTLWLLAVWLRPGGRLPLAPIAGLAAAGLLVGPFALWLAHAKLLPGSGIAPDIRRFLPLEEMCDIGGVEGPARAVVSMLALPVNYAMEFGFFGAVGVLYLRRRFGRWRDASPDAWWELLCLLGSLAVGTFLRSTIRCNDLGWRGLIPAQLTLLLWAAEYGPELLRRPAEGDPPAPRARRRERAVLLTMLVLGAAFSALEPVNLRLHHVLRERYPLPPVELPGEATYEARTVYERLRREAPVDAVVQHNPQPQVYRPDFWPALYGGRQMAASGGLHGSIFGIPESYYRPVEDELSAVFRTESWSAAAGAARKHGIDYLVVQDTDPSWKLPRGWVRTRQPDIETDRFRVFRVE